MNTGVDQRERIVLDDIDLDRTDLPGRRQHDLVQARQSAHRRANETQGFRRHAANESSGGARSGPVPRYLRSHGLRIHFARAGGRVRHSSRCDARSVATRSPRRICANCWMPSTRSRSSEARGVILTAEGPVFSAGHDFADMNGRDLDAMRRLLFVCADVMQAIQALPQPVIAQVDGLATAAGCQLVATCDLAVASASSRFQVPGGRGGWFCTTPGVALARAVGRKHAFEMLATGDAIDAATALAWGLVNRVVAGEAVAARNARSTGACHTRKPARKGRRKAGLLRADRPRSFPPPTRMPRKSWRPPRRPRTHRRICTHSSRNALPASAIARQSWTRGYAESRRGPIGQRAGAAGIAARAIHGDASTTSSSSPPIAMRCPPAPPIAAATLHVHRIDNTRRSSGRRPGDRAPRSGTRIRRERWRRRHCPPHWTAAVPERGRGPLQRCRRSQCRGRPRRPPARRPRADCGLPIRDRVRPL